MEKHRDGIRIYLIIISIVWFISLFPALFMAMFSPMMFDAPGSETSSWTIAAASVMLSYPLVAVLGIIFSWVFFAKNKLKTALVFSLLPVVWIGLNISIWVCIELFCDGKFTC